MNLICKKLGYSLNQENKLNKKIFNLVKKNIPNTFFSLLGFSFFSFIVKKKIIDIFLIKKNKKLVSILTFIKTKNLRKLKKHIFFFLLINPLKFFINLIFVLKSMSRGIGDLFDNRDFLHLLHLIILKNSFNKIKLHTKDNILNFFFKKILEKNNAKNIFLCYDISNFKAHRFYLRNNFKIYLKKGEIVFVKKKII